VNKLVELLSMSSPYARATYAAKKVKHVLICGTITPVCVCVCVCVCVYLPYPKMTGVSLFASRRITLVT
jgi:hypothetical protein